MNNPKKIIIAAFSLLVLLFCLFSFVAFSKSQFSVSAKSAALYEPTSGEFIYSKNKDAPLPMASTTKIMTALVALRECDNLEEEIEIEERAVGIEGSSAYFAGGEIFTLSDLLHIMMLRSANDAAYQIAYSVSGDIDSFAELMNETAKDLGLKNTSFTNPAGFDNENHYTTAGELAIITAEAMKYREFSDIVAKKSYTATDIASGEGKLFVNHNKLLSMYDGCVGVKTGYTKKSGRSLVSAATRDGVTLIAVTINAPNDWSDHEKMLDYGFSELEFSDCVKSRELCFELPVVNSKTTAVYARPASDFGFVARRGGVTDVLYDLPKYLIAPVCRGDTVGKITVKHNGITVGTVDIICEQSAEKEKTFFEKLTEK